MRVIAGRAKGRRLFSPVPGVDTRPITDRAKESLFSILGSEIVNARFLDLFAGTGSVGIEALSRGATHATFIENSRKAYKTVLRNLVHTQLDAEAEVIMGDATRYLTGAAESFDFIFIAPPQYQELWSKTLHLIDEKPAWLSVRGIAIVQIDPKEYYPLTLTNLTNCDRRCYGNVMLCFYNRNLPEN